jgi:GNAT superfamily N-acetyltransferase
MTLESAVEVFVQAFCRVKSRHWPYLARRHEGLWVMEDAPGRRQPRKSEVVAVGLGPEEVVRLARESGVGWHFVVHIGDGPDSRAAYKSLGYRALATERLFLHDLRAVPEFESDPPARRVGSAEELARVPQTVPQPRRLFPGDDLYGVWDEAREHGWVERIVVGQASYPSSLYVFPESRGRGFGRALMSRVLRDDRDQGLGASVLVASRDGARLYPHLGYREVARFEIFCPVRR